MAVLASESAVGALCEHVCREFESSQEVQRHCQCSNQKRSLSYQHSSARRSFQVASDAGPQHEYLVDPGAAPPFVFSANAPNSTPLVLRMRPPLPALAASGSGSGCHWLQEMRDSDMKPRDWLSNTSFWVDSKHTKQLQVVIAD